MRARFFINDVEVNEPNNYAELGIELNYDPNDIDSQAVTINEWELGVGGGDLQDGESAARNHFLQGLTSGVGVGEGIPFKIIIDGENGRTYTVFDGYLNLATASYYNGSIKAASTSLTGADWLSQVKESFTFDYLDSIGRIDSSKYKAVPYCINKKQNAFEVIIAVLTVFVVVDKIQEQITNIGEKVTSAANPFMATNTFSIIVRIIYIIALFVSLIGLVLRLYNMLVQPVKYHYGMYAKDLLQAGCDYLGVKFSSSILQKAPFDKLFILPEKYTLPEGTGLLSGLSGIFDTNPSGKKGFYKGTFGSLLDSLQIMFDARVIVKYDTLYFEKQDFNLGASAYEIPDTYDSRFNYTLNWEDLKATYLISFALDSNDRNTIQEYTGTSVQVTTAPKAITNKRMVLLQGLQEVRIPFALAKRKESLNVIEQIINVFLKGIAAIVDAIITILNLIIKLLNAIIKVINALIKALRIIGLRLNFQIPTIPEIQLSGFGNLIEDRVGMMVMESDFVNTPKIMLLNSSGNARNTKIGDENFTYLRARYLYETYHSYRSFLGEKGQAYYHELPEVPFPFEDFEKIKENKSITNYAGEEGELLSIKWNPIKQTATGRYKIYKKYTNNLIESINEPTGS